MAEFDKVSDIPVCKWGGLQTSACWSLGACGCQVSPELLCVICRKDVGQAVSTATDGTREAMCATCVGKYKETVIHVTNLLIGETHDE